MAYEDGKHAFRVITVEDLDRLALHRNQPETWKNLTSSLPVWPHNQFDWLKGLGQKDFYFMAEYLYNGMGYKDVGLIRLTDVDFVNSTAAIGVDIFRPFRKCGLGQNFFNLATRYAFMELNLNRLWLLVLEDNIAGIKIYSRAGFKNEGVLRKHIFRGGKYKNYVLMGLMRDEWTDKPLKPIDEEICFLSPQ